MFDLFGMAALPVQGASASLKVSHNAAPQQNEGIPDGGGGCAVVPTGAQQLGQAQHGPRSVARSAGDHHVDTSAGAARRGTGPAPAAAARAPGAQPHHLDDRAPRRHRRGAGPRPARRTGLASPTIKAGSASTATSRTSTMRSRTGAWAPLSGQLVG